MPEPGAPPPAPDFGLHLDLSQTGGLPLGVSRGKTSSSPGIVHVDRFAGSNGPLSAVVTGLPAGVGAAVVADNLANPTRYEIRLTATKTATIAIGSTFTFTVTPASTASGLQARSVQIPFSVVEDYDLAVAGIEVTQGTQVGGQLSPRVPKGLPAPSYKGVPLVKLKQTVARVFPVVATPAGVTVKGATILLYGARQDGGALPGSPLHTTAKVSSGNPDQVSEAARETGKAVNFTLPPSWTTKGKIKLEAQIVPPVVLFSGPSECGSPACAADNRYRLSGIGFGDTGYLNVAALRLEVSGQQFALPGAALAGFEQLLPLADGELRRADDWRAEYDVTAIVNATSYQQLFGICPLGWTASACAAMPDLDPLLVEYAVDFDPSEQGCSAIFVQQRPPYCHDAALALVDDTGIANTSGVAGLSKPRTVHVLGARAVANLRRPLTSVAHELVHGLGLKHASAGCGGGANGQKAAGWPDPWGTIEGIGYDMRDGRVIYTGNAPPRVNPPAGAPARAWYDFMSYCADVTREWQLGLEWPWRTSDAWISPVNWKLLYQSLRAIGRHLASPAAAARVRSAASGGARATLQVRGFVDDGKVVLARIEPHRGVPTPSTPSPYRLTLRDIAGGTIAEAPMVVESTEGHGKAVDFLTADVPLPGARASSLPSALASIEVATDAGVQARAVRSAHAPVVRIHGPRRGARVGRRRRTTISWRATDPDGERLTAMVEYSPDDGRSWQLVWKGPNHGRTTVASRLLSASRRARLQVRVSDGFNETASVSPRFVAIGSRPTVRVMSPDRRRLRLRADALLYLSASATDDRFRRIPDRRITWFDGRRRIARGGVTSVAGLRPGRHRLRVVARDRLGRTGSSTRMVVVRAVAPRLLPRSLPRRISRRARRLRIVLASTLPARVTAAGPSVRRRRGHHRPRWRIGTRARAIRIPIRPGAGRVELSLRARAFGHASTLTLSLPRR